MREKFSLIVALVVLVLLTLATWWASDYANNAVLNDPPARIDNNPDAWTKHFLILQTKEDGLPSSKIEGYNLRHYPSDNRYEADLPSITFLPQGQSLTTGASDTMILRNGKNTVIMQGNANLHRQPSEHENELEIFSEELIYHNQDNLILSNKPTTVYNGRSHLKGTGMTYNLLTRELKVLSKTDLKVSDNQRQKHTF